MQIQVNKSKKREVPSVQIFVGESRFTITESGEGEIRIVKYADESLGILMCPELSNVIRIQ